MGCGVPQTRSYTRLRPLQLHESVAFHASSPHWTICALLYASILSQIRVSDRACKAQSPVQLLRCQTSTQAHNGTDGLFLYHRSPYSGGNRRRSSTPSAPRHISLPQRPQGAMERRTRYCCGASYHRQTGLTATLWCECREVALCHWVRFGVFREHGGD